MMIAEFKAAGGNNPSRNVPRGPSSVPLTTNRNHPILGPSVRLPVTPENRSRLRALRLAELHAWNRASRTGANAALRAEVKRAAQEGKRESRMFAGIVIPAAIAVTLGGLASLRFVEHHADFVAFVRQLLGLA